MTDARKILEMIENVAVDDVAALDEIDARVTAYITFGGNKYIAHGGNKVVVESSDGGRGEVYLSCYTRSRNLLKLIRPDGYWVTIYTGPNGTKCTITHCDHVFKSDYNYTGEGKNEELAELHAILQALDHARNASTGGV